MDPAGLGQKKPGPCALRWTPGHEEPKRGNLNMAANPLDSRDSYTRVFNTLMHRLALGKRNSYQRCKMPEKPSLLSPAF
jgi:hypothetical protein